MAMGCRNRNFVCHDDGRRPAGSALGSAAARHGLSYEHWARPLPFRGRAALVCRPQRLQRHRHRRRHGRGVEGADPAPAAGALRRAGMGALGRFTRRLEPARIGGDVRVLPGGVFARARPRAARCHTPRRSVTGELSRRLPGDPSPADAIARMLRVDHAGEYGATRIYGGQLDVLGHGRAGVIRQMAETENRHLARFETLLRERQVRPTLLHPLWTITGYALGAATALLGQRAAMACTVAVEEVID